MTQQKSWSAGIELEEKLMNENFQEAWTLARRAAVMFDGHNKMVVFVALAVLVSYLVDEDTVIEKQKILDRFIEYVKLVLISHPER